MDLNRDLYDKIQTATLADQKAQKSKSLDNDRRW